MLKAIYTDILFWIACTLGFQNLAFLLETERLFVASTGCLLVSAILATRGASGQWQKDRGKLWIVGGMALPSIGNVLDVPRLISFSLMLVLAVTGLVIVVLDAHRKQSEGSVTLGDRC
jgi:hypothetical protein